MVFLDTLNQTLPLLGKMCAEVHDPKEADLSQHIQEGCCEFKGRHPNMKLIDLLVYMEYEASTLESNNEMVDAMRKYIEDPKPLPDEKFSSVKDKYSSSTQTMDSLRAHAAKKQRPPLETIFSPPELLFLHDHSAQYLPNMAALGAEAIYDHIYACCPEFKKRHPRADIFEVLFFMDQMIRIGEDVRVKALEFIRHKTLPRIVDMTWGRDAELVKAKRQEALNFLDTLRDEPDSEDEELPNFKDPATTYDAAARRSFRDPFVGTADDPSADRCVIADPETQEPVEADIVGRHPHRRKWLVCAIPSLNPRYPKLERFPTIDGSTSQYRNVLENYSLRGSNRTIPVGGMEDLVNCGMKDFELNGVILLPWGDDTRISGFGVSNWKRNEFKIFAKTVCCNKWGRSGLAMLHSHLQKCGSPIPTGKGKAELEIEPRSWYG
jgi:hypothetical protein